MRTYRMPFILFFMSMMFAFPAWIQGMEAEAAAQPLPPARSTSLILQYLKNITIMCIINNYRPILARKWVGTLARLNKELKKYYAHESTRKEIVRKISRNSNYSDFDVARKCDYEKITNKIKTLFSIAKDNQKEFHAGDFKDKWYLSVTKTGIIGKFRMRLTLLHMTTAACNVEKTKALMKAGCHCTFKGSSPIAILAGPDPVLHDYYKLVCEEQAKHFSLYKLFVSKKVNPDDRCAITAFTYLHRVVNKGDKKRTRVLLEAGAHPYNLFFDDLHAQRCRVDTEKINKLKRCSIGTLYQNKDNGREPWMHNAFTLERGEPKGWLQGMYVEVQKNLVIEYSHRRRSKKTESK